MIAYTTLGTRDLPRASRFYDALLAELGAKRAMEMDRMVIWANDPAAPMFAVCLPFDGQPASAGNGAMVSLAAGNPETVQRVHAKALELGATDEGQPGPRGPQFYIAYFRDPDGNKLAVFHSL